MLSHAYPQHTDGGTHVDEPTVVRRKPRYILGTFWMVLGILALVGGLADGKVVSVLLSPLLIAYSVYLYRGGRFGFIIW
jgi:hypothetical protein